MNSIVTPEKPLSAAEPGSRVRIVRIGGGGSFKSKMISLGLMPNTVIEIMNCDGCIGPMAIKVNQTRIVIGRGMAEKVIVADT
ncbi:MAG: FeoA family protein [Spirochaetota bacterium]